MIYEIKTPQQDRNCRSVEQSFSFSTGRRDMIGNKETNISFFMRGAEMYLYILLKSINLKQGKMLLITM